MYNLNIDAGAVFFPGFNMYDTKTMQGLPDSREAQPLGRVKSAAAELVSGMQCLKDAVKRKIEKRDGVLPKEQATNNVLTGSSASQTASGRRMAPPPNPSNKLPHGQEQTKHKASSAVSCVCVMSNHCPILHSYCLLWAFVSTIITLMHSLFWTCQQRRSVCQQWHLHHASCLSCSMVGALYGCHHGCHHEC